MGWKKTALISVSLIIGALLVLGLIFSTEPEAERSGASKQTAMLVDVVTVEKGTYHPVISVTGTVRPSKEIMLGARVEGEVVHRSPDFVPGGYVEKGDVILQIDSTDFVNLLKQAKSALQQAESELQRELGLQQAAQREYKLLDDTLSEANRALVLRQPQLNSVKAQVASARATVNQAHQNLDRTTIRAPFNAYVISQDVNIGSLVSPGQNLGQLVGDDIYWVESAVPLNRLQWLQFENEGEGSPVEVKSKTAWGEGVSRQGHLFRMVGTLDDQTRMARVLVEVEDPLSVKEENKAKPALIIGSFVETNIQGKTLEDVVRVNRNYLRNNETVWVMNADTLDIRDVEVLFQDANNAYIKSGLQSGDRVVISNLANVTEGSPLRVNSEENTTSERGESDE